MSTPLPGHGPSEFTLEDLATFRRCRKESFWRGSVPMVIGSSMLVGLAQSRGFFANRPRLLMPCYVLASIFGYIGGKISYIGRCKSMFMELHDSRVKDFLLGHQQYFPCPPTPSFSMDRSLPKSDPVIVETPTTYAQRREYYRQQQLQDRRPDHPQSSWQLQDEEKRPQQQQQQPSSSSAPASSEYFDTNRPLSSFFSDDDYKPKD